MMVFDYGSSITTDPKTFAAPLNFKRCETQVWSKLKALILPAVVEMTEKLILVKL